MMWLSRETVRAPYMTLCLSEDEYLKAVKHCKVKNPDRWLSPRMMACVHYWEQDDKSICIVCLMPDIEKHFDPIAVASMLVHESVHIFQYLCRSIGEDNPGVEFEAYSIQRISETLMREYSRRLGAA